MAETDAIAQQLDEQRRINVWLQQELERQRHMNTTLRAATAELARAFQGSLNDVEQAIVNGDVSRIHELRSMYQQQWRQHLQQIVGASKQAAPAVRPLGKDVHESNT